MRLLDEVRAYEAAGAFAVEIEVVPAEVATLISERVDILLWSMGAGAGCDAQYLFANDLLGYTEGKCPRHSKAYRDFAGEAARLQRERVAAFASSRPTWRAAPTRRSGTSCAWRPTSSRRSGTDRRGLRRAVRTQGRDGRREAPGLREPRGGATRPARIQTQGGNDMLRRTLLLASAAWP
jgi:hypothetical protein